MKNLLAFILFACFPSSLADPRNRLPAEGQVPATHRRSNHLPGRHHSRLWSLVWGELVMSQWIKCSDRLPEIGAPCLIRIPVGKHFNAESGEYRGDGLWRGAWCSARGEGHCYKVTQWAPMPEEAE